MSVDSPAPTPLASRGLSGPPAYAELHCASNFSFLKGASQPEELVDRAHALGYSALALTDECSLAGVVRAHLQARSQGLPLIIGSQFDLPACTEGTTPDNPPGDPPGAAPGNPSGTRLVLLACNREGYGGLSNLISTARLRAPKGHYALRRSDLETGLTGCLALLVPSPRVLGTHPLAQQHRAAFADEARFIAHRFPGNTWIAVGLLANGFDSALLAQLRELSARLGLPLVACGDVRFHVRSRKSLYDTLTAIRLRQPLDRLGWEIAPNAEQHLRSRLRLAQRYPVDLLEQTLEIASRCAFSLDTLRYEYPDEIVPHGHTPGSWLRTLTQDGARERYPQGLPEPVREQIEHELQLVAELRYEPYFLTVADLVRFARSRGILCQGRGSAANSAICYCLGITEVDPARMQVLFERFISRERNEPPDIDVDFEHQRREEVIQYLYQRYGRHRAALAAAVSTYRPRSALRDVGKALGLDPERVDRLAVSESQWQAGTLATQALHEAGFDPEAPIVQHWLRLASRLIGFPRHLSQHSGGFVIARDALTRLVPIENTAMAGRTVIQWDKDDLDALGLLKVDVLALGMLSAIRRALGFISHRRGGTPFRIQDIPAECPDTYEMISAADTVGVFQIESRAQMSMLPRLKPRTFYDLVIEVAIVRPGPIHGGMVHPYLRRRQGLEPVHYPRDEIRPALERTLGVPIFQEQVMQIAMCAAGFTPGEADQLRRAMAAWRRKGGLSPFQARLRSGLRERGYPEDFAESVCRQVEGFGEYGFPESHAASFALLVYVSSWIKRHEPAAFLAALLDSQPMGFYAPAQLVRDAREHGVEVRPVCVLESHWDCRLEERSEAPPDVREGVDWRPQPAVRLGLNQVQGLSESAARTLVEIRESRRQAGRTPLFESTGELARVARLDRRDLQALARADALAHLAGHRFQAAWEVAALAPQHRAGLLAHTEVHETTPNLNPPSAAQTVLADYRATGLSLVQHPVALLRSRLGRFGIQPAEVLRSFPDGRIARASGLVTHRQRPGTAAGVVFITLEDETGSVNVIVWPRLFEHQRAEILGATLMTVYGVWQTDPSTGGQVMHLVARRIVDHSPLLADLGTLRAPSRDFH